MDMQLHSGGKGIVYNDVTKVIAARPDDLCSLSRTHMAKGEKGLPQGVLHLQSMA